MVQPLLYTLSETIVVGLNIQRKLMHDLGIALIALIALLCNAALSFLLVPNFGAVGAAVSNTLAFMVFFVTRTEVSSRLWREVPRGKLYGAISFFILVSIITAIFGSGAFVHYSFFWALIFGILIRVFIVEIKQLVVFIRTGFRSQVDSVFKS